MANGRTIALVLLVAATLTGCTATAAAPPAGPTGITGDQWVTIVFYAALALVIMALIAAHAVADIRIAKHRSVAQAAESRAKQAKAEAAAGRDEAVQLAKDVDRG